MNKPHAYPKGWGILHLFGIAMFLGLVVVGAYIAITEPFSPRVFAAEILIIAVGIVMLGVSLFEWSNRATIILDDREIIAFKPAGRVRIAWSEIDRVYYTTSQGEYSDQPVFSLYVFSKHGEFIKITQNIDAYFDLMEMIVRRSPRGQAEPISLMKLLRLLFQVYFSKGQEKGGHRRIPHL